MVSPVYSIFWEQFKALKPSFASKKPHFNFITVHCELLVLGNPIGFCWLTFVPQTSGY